MDLFAYRENASMAVTNEWESDEYFYSSEQWICGIDRDISKWEVSDILWQIRSESMFG